MTNYSFDPPAKRAMDEEELSELISGLSADESGIEKAMKILQEQEALRAEDEQNFSQWREEMMQIGSIEALQAVEKATGEVLIEPEPETNLSADSEAPDEELSQVQDGAEAVDLQGTEDQLITDPEEAEAEDADSGEMTVETNPRMEAEVKAETVEVFEELTVVSTETSFEADYRSVVTISEPTKIETESSVREAAEKAIASIPKKIRQKYSSKLFLGFILGAGIFGILVALQLTVIPASEWSSLGVIAGSLLGFAVFSAQGFQKHSFTSQIIQKLQSFGLYWRVALVLGVSAIAVGVSNLLRDNRFFVDIEVQPAIIVDYEFDEITLMVSLVLLVAALVAWQPALRSALLKLLATLSLVSVFSVALFADGSEIGFGDWDYRSFTAGLSAAFITSVLFGLLVQPNFAADHDRPNWAVGEFSTRRGRVSVLHGLLFILLPGILSVLFVGEGLAMGNKDAAIQLGLLIAIGMAALVVLVGVFSDVSVSRRMIAFVLVVAGLVAGEYLTNQWVQGISTIGVLLISTLVGSGLVVRFIGRESNRGWLALVAIVLGLVVGWLIENPFGLLDLGFDGYTELQGFGLGVSSAALLSALISLALVSKAKADENS